MNILVLNYEFPPIGGGGATVSYDVSKGLVAIGHNVHVVTMKYKNLPCDEEIDGMHIHRVNCIRKQAFVCHPWEQLSYIISAICYLNKYLKRSKVDVVHCHFIIPTGCIAWYLKKKYKINYVLTAHGSDVIGHNKKRFRLLYKMILKPWKNIVREASATIALSSYLRSLICRSMGGEYSLENVSIIPNGIYTKLYKVQKKEKIILLMGRIQEEKGMQDILRILTPKMLGDWKVEIVGDGPFKPELEKIVYENDISNFVHFWGWIRAKSDKQLELLSKSYIFISASRFENSPVTLLEAYCSGCKVLVSDIPAHKEMIGDRANYFDTNDGKMLKDTLIKMMRSYQEQRALPTGIERFDWKEKIYLYDQILSEYGNNEEEKNCIHN